MAPLIAAMVPAHLTVDVRMVHHPGQERTGTVNVEETVPVLGMARSVPDRIVDAQTDKPAKQQINVQPFHQLAPGSDRIESLQQQSPK